MPGIVGFISTECAENRRGMLDQMLGSMRHEPFYTSGSFIDKTFDLAVGWVCHSGSFSDCLPIWNEQNDICLIFLGEHFADQADAEMLRRKGHSFSPDNASWLVHLYEEVGEKFFETLNGAFSGLLVDRRKHKVVLFNERYGLSRIYYCEAKDGFYFASEAKALLRVLPQLRQLDMVSLGEFFSCGCPLQDRTLFSGVSLLPGASAWTFAPGQAVKKENYFQKASWEAFPELPAEEYYARMNETFIRVLPRYFQGTQRVTLSLTGGLDSRMIIACASPAPTTLPCHTFGSMYRECADVRLAKQVAQTSGQVHEVVPVAAKFFSEFPSLAERSVYYTDGAMDVTGSADLFVNRTIREHSPVRMTGNYGSEILKSHVAFKTTSLCDSMFSPAFASYVKNAATVYASERCVPRISFIAFKQVPWHHHARFAVEQSQLTLRSPFLDNELVAVAFRAPADQAVNQALRHRFIAEHNPKLARIPTDRGVIGGNGAVTGKLRTFCQEFIPRAEYVYDYGMPQWLAKIDRFTSPLHIERLFLGRQKFCHFRLWYRNQLSDYVKEVLMDPRTLSRPYLNGKRVEEIVTAHVTGRGNYTLEIHKLLTSELIQRNLIERN